MNDQFNFSFQYVQHQSCSSIIKTIWFATVVFPLCTTISTFVVHVLTEREEPPEMFRLRISLKHQQYLYDRVNEEKVQTVLIIFLFNVVSTRQTLFYHTYYFLRFHCLNLTFLRKRHLPCLHEQLRHLYSAYKRPK